MGISAGMLLVALGAILTWAVHDNISGIDLGIVGIILMIAGAAGVVMSLMSSSSGETSPVNDRRHQ